jgi:hypothetical protein
MQFLLCFAHAICATILQCHASIVHVEDKINLSTQVIMEASHNVQALESDNSLQEPSPRPMCAFVSLCVYFLFFFVCVPMCMRVCVCVFVCVCVLLC